MKPAPTLSTAFLHPAGQSLPEPLLALRKQRGTALVDMPLPTRKTENWKYSSKYLKLTDDMAISLPADGKTGSGLAVPDWPTTFGENMFTFAPSKWVGGIFYEHGHRLIAATVGFLTIGLALWLWLCESRSWLRGLGGIALLAVIFQGILGGMTVRFQLPTEISVFHACLAQTFFCIVVSIAVFTSPGWKRRPEAIKISRGFVHKMCVLMMLVVFIQLLLGALMRHTESGLAVPDFPLAYGKVLPDLSPIAVEGYNQERAFAYFLPPVTVRQIVFHLLHRLGAVLVTLTLLITTIAIFRKHGKMQPLRRPAILALIFLFLQIGLGAWTVWSGRTPWIATVHVAVGAATLATCWVLTLRVYGYLQVVKRESVTTSMAIAGATA